MDLPAFRRSLLRWFANGKRPLPWRQTRDAYAIWVSEIMLQQTTVATVIPYYARFMARFPDVEALAASREDDVMALWSGLGYYSRARNLRLAAQTLVAEHGGRFPHDVERAMSLKGVGRYTASAVTSIAFGTPAAVVDGNVRRVLSRVYAERHLSPARAEDLATRLLARRAAGPWNEAMMELGATVCTPRKPSCPLCPIASRCQGKDRPEHWSEGAPRRATLATRVEMALVIREDSVLLVRNPASSLMGGLLDLPHTGLPGRADARLADSYAALRIAPTPIAAVRHAVTHHRIKAVVFSARLGRAGRLPDAEFHRLSDLETLPLSGLTRKALRAAGQLSD
jgi:A/G-specific adenine glycosylase